MPSAWRRVSIGELGKVFTGRTPPSSDPGLFGAEYPFITPTDIRNDDVHVQTERFLSAKGFESQKQILLPPDTVCFVCIGATIGKSCLTDRPSFTNQQINSVVVNKSQHDPRFIFHLLRLNAPRVKGIAGGAATPIVNKTAFSALEVCIPDLRIQRRIGAIFGGYDDLIENNTRRIETLEAMAQMLYREWFVNFRFPGYEKVKMAESEIGLIPNGWQVSGIGEVATKVGSGATPRGGKKSYQATGISLIRSLNVYDYRFEMDDLAFINDEQAQQLDNVTVEPEDVLLNITGASVGRCAIVPSYILPARVNQHVAIIRANPTKIDPFFLLDTINHDRNKQRLLGMAQGGATREALTRETIIEFRILLPPFDLISQYAQIASQLHKQREKLSRKNEVLRSTRELLVPKLVSGEVSVEQLEAEVPALTV